jgi:hypothetical protein
LPKFPLIKQHQNLIEKHVEAVREQEKGVRDDLSVTAASYLVQLKRRPLQAIPSDQFYKVKFR